MIRSNVGNVVTNGQQIISVGAFTAGGLKRSLGRADTALNNLSKEERQKYTQMRADKMRDEINAYNSKSASPTQLLSEEERQEYTEMRANKMRDEVNAYNSKKAKDSDIEDVDKIMEGISIDDSDTPPILQENSEQAPELNINMMFNREWRRSLYVTHKTINADD